MWSLRNVCVQRCAVVTWLMQEATNRKECNTSRCPMCSTTFTHVCSRWRLDGEYSDAPEYVEDVSLLARAPFLGAFSVCFGILVLVGAFSGPPCFPYACSCSLSFIALHSASYPVGQQCPQPFPRLGIEVEHHLWRDQDYGTHATQVTNLHITKAAFKQLTIFQQTVVGTVLKHRIVGTCR